MQQRYAQPADFWQERDFGGKISAAFEFIGAHWKPLGKCLAYLVLPPALLGGIGFGLFANKFYSYAALSAASQKAGRFGSYSPADALSVVGVMLGILGLLLAAVMLSATLYGYLRVQLSLPPGEVVQPRQVWQAVRARLGWVVLGVLVLGVLGMIGSSVLFGAVAMGVGLMGSSVGSVFLAMLLTAVPILYVLVAMSLYFPVLWLENRGIFGAVGRSFQLVQGNWWATAGLLLVGLLLQWMLGLVFAIPQWAVLVGKMLQIPFLDSNVLGVFTQCISLVGSVVLNALPLLILAFHYLSLVEQRDATGSLLLLGQLGHAPAAAPALEADYYRPDDEGEY